MIQNLVVNLIICAHVLGDFYLQTAALSEKKKGNYGGTIIHCILYSVPFFVLFLVFSFRGSFPFPLFLLLIGSHALIDIIKCAVEKRTVFSSTNKALLYLIDQGAHFLFIIGGSWYFLFHASANSVSSTELAMIASKVLLFCLLVLKPTNITFKLLFAKYQYEPQKTNTKDPILQNKPQPTSVKGAGALIGNLERLIMGIFLFLHQYAAVGLVLTAKSITRYNKIAKDPAFSEYYLIGTLYSLLVTLVVFLGVVYIL